MSSEKAKCDKVLLVVLSRETARKAVKELWQCEVPQARFRVPAVDAVLDKYDCCDIKPRFPEELPIPESIQEEFGSKRMFLLLFPENTPMDQLEKELLSTSCVESASPPPLRYALDSLFS